MSEAERCPYHTTVGGRQSVWERQCRFDKGHEGPHKTESGQVIWDDFGRRIRTPAAPKIPGRAE